MRKIKKPNLTVKPREIFYRLKRSKKLEDLTEERIAEILEEANPQSLVQPACLYENFSRESLEDGLNKGPGSIVTFGVVTLGDAGFEAVLKRASEEESGLARHKVLLAWGLAYLDKLAEFINSLVREEAVQENLELGPSGELDIEKETVFLDFAWNRLDPAEKIGVKLVRDVLDGKPRLEPAFSRAWTIPWLTKKEKKQLAAA